jgi:hypothetical protein
MSFSIKPLHERLFRPVVAKPIETTVYEEETFFIVDERTGEIKEQTQIVEKKKTVESGAMQPAEMEQYEDEDGNIYEQPVPVPQPLPVPVKTNRHFGFAMKKNTKASFM